MTDANTMILILGLLSVVSGQVMEGLVQLDKSSIDKVRQIKLSLNPNSKQGAGSFMPFMEMEAFSTFHSNFGFYIVNRGKEMAV